METVSNSTVVESQVELRETIILKSFGGEGVRFYEGIRKRDKE